MESGVYMASNVGRPYQHPSTPSPPKGSREEMACPILCPRRCGLAGNHAWLEHGERCFVRGASLPVAQSPVGSRLWVSRFGLGSLSFHVRAWAVSRSGPCRDSRALKGSLVRAVTMRCSVHPPAQVVRRRISEGSSSRSAAPSRPRASRAVPQAFDKRRSG